MKDMKDNAFTYVVPSLNAEKYLRNALDGIIEQTGVHNAKLVMIDDGSSDATYEIMSRFKEESSSHFSDVIVIQNAKNLGKLACLNSAGEHISTPYVIIADADDCLLPEYTLKCFELLEKERQEDPLVQFVYTNCKIQDPSLNYLCDGLSTSFDPQLIQDNSFIPDCALTTSELYKKVLPLDESVRKNPKHLRWKNIIETGAKGVHLAEPLFRYTMHENNLSGIGSRILDEVSKGQQNEKILSGYWGLTES